MTRITCDADVLAGMDGLQALSKKRHGPQWRAIIAASGAPPLRLQQGGFEGLARIIVSQQLSVASARAIWAKVVAIIVPLTPERFLAATEDELRQAGLSRPKQRTLLAISAAVVEKLLVLEGLTEATAEDIHAQMTAVKGIGPWTADIYLMFCLGHADAFAPGDLALQEAARIGFGLKQRPNPKEMAKIAENWKPWRGVAARLLWSYYAVVKTREGINAG